MAVKKKTHSVRHIACIILRNMRKKHRNLGVKYKPEFTVEEISEIIESGKCSVTNRGFNCKNITKYRVNPFMASPDRINNNIGYRKNNVRWVMVWVNLARHEYEIDFFKDLMKGVKW